MSETEQREAAEAINWLKLNKLVRDVARALLHAVAQLLYETHYSALEESLKKNGVELSGPTDDVVLVCAAVIRRCKQDRRWVQAAVQNRKWPELREHLPLVSAAGAKLLEPVQCAIAKSKRFDVTMLCDLLLHGNLGVQSKKKPDPADERGKAVAALRNAILRNGVLSVVGVLNHNRDVALSGARYAEERDRLLAALKRLADAAHTIGTFRFDRKHKAYAPLDTKARAKSSRLRKFKRARGQFENAWRAVENGSYSLANVERMRAVFEHEHELGLHDECDHALFWLRTHAPLAADDNDNDAGDTSNDAIGDAVDVDEMQNDDSGYTYDHDDDDFDDDDDDVAQHAEGKQKAQ